jgi:VCBS repeat-containing protein
VAPSVEPSADPSPLASGEPGRGRGLPSPGTPFAEPTPAASPSAAQPSGSGRGVKPNKSTVSTLAASVSALDFDGTNDFVTFGAAPSLGLTSFTLEAWFRREGAGVGVTTGSGGIVSAIPLVTKGRGEGESPANLNMNYFLGIDATSGRLVADFEDTAGGVNHPINGTAVVSSNVWHHAAVTYASGTWNLYLDGVLDKTETEAGAVPESTSIQHAGIATAMTSAGNTGAAGFFAGVIDEVRIWNFARSAGDIAAARDLELTSGSGLVGRWGMNENTGTSVGNSVAGGVTGTATNGPVWVPGFEPPGNAAPVAVADSYSTQADTTLNVAAPGVLGNDTDANGNPLTAVLNADVSHGSLTLNANGSFSYTPTTGFGGSDSFTYHANDGTDDSNVVTVSIEVGKGALDLGASGANVRFGDPAKLDLATFTIETWFKRTGAGVAGTTGTGGITAFIPLVTHGGPQGDGSNVDANWLLGINDATDALAADFEDMATGGNHPISGATAITDNVWHHAAATYDGTTWRLYLDGQLDATEAENATPRSDSIQHAGLGIMLDSAGAPANGSAARFRGVLDETRVWSGARSLNQIRATVNSELTSGTNLVARWGMGEESGTVVGDSIATAADGTINGTGYARVGKAPFNIPVDTTPPAAPTGLNATAGNGSVDLTWDANAESDLAGYNVYRNTTSPVALTSPLNGGTLVAAPTYLDSTAVNGQQYFYAVTAVDDSNNESAASNEDSATPTAPPEQPTGLDLGSAGAYVSFGDPTKLDLGTFTIETWFRRTGPGVSGTTGGSGIPAFIPLVTHGAPQAEGSNVDANWLLGIDDATDRLAADFEDMATGANHPIIGTTTITDNAWHHAAATYDGTTWRLYIDGRLDKTEVESATPRSDSTQHSGLGVMLDSSGSPANTARFQGVLDEARVWTGARTLAQIRSGIHQMPAPTTGLVARWGMGEGTGTIVGDSVALAANGTILGTGTSWPAGAPFDIPTVSAGADQDVTLPDSGVLDGLALDDGQPSALTTTWTQVSGPDTAAIADPSSASTTVSFTGSGTGDYVFRLTANDGLNEVFDEVAYTVLDPGAEPNFGLDFDGVNDHVTFGNATTLGLAQFTLETWFRRDGAGDTVSTGTGGIPVAEPLITKGRGEADDDNRDMNYFFGLDASGHLVADFEEGAAGFDPGLNHPITGTTAIQTGTWYHAAATYDGTTWRLYLNGALDGTLVVDQPVRSDSIQHAGLATAMTSNGTTDGAFNGVLDEARIWNHARTESEIQAGMIGPLTAGTGLVARWGMNEGTGSTIGSTPAPTINGTLVNGPLWVTGTPFVSTANSAPNVPTNVAPADGATGVSANPTLQVEVSDPNGGQLTTSFYGRTAGPGAAEDFTIVVLPDTQHYVDNATRTATFNQQTQWIVDNANDLNVVFVSQLGDLTENFDTVEVEFQRADSAMDILDNNGIPNNLAPGNHDLGTGGTTSTYYDQYFPPSRYAPHSSTWYGGWLGEETGQVQRLNKDNYELFTAGGIDFLIIHLEIDMPSYAVQWANEIIDRYPDRQVILSTHAFVNTSNARGGSLVTGRADGMTAAQVWTQLVSPNCNVFMVVNGHYPGEGQLTSNNSCGEPVHQVLTDYQSRANGGDGWLRYYTFKPASNTVEAYTYSPKLGTFETDAGSQFSLPYEMGAIAGFELIGSVDTASGSTASMAWPGRAPSTAYEWYAVTNDGTATRTSPTWTFTTAGAPTNSPPNVTNPGPQTSAEGEVVDLAIEATDPDSDPLAYSAAELPDGLTINASTGQITGTVGPGAAASSPYNVTVTVSDGQAAPVDVMFTWTVNATTFTLSGDVTTSGGPLAGTFVYIFSATGQSYIGAATMGPGAAYSIAVPAGSYKAYVQTNNPGYPDQWIGGSSYETASPIAVSANTSQDLLLASPPTSLQAWWKMDGDATDSSGLGNHASLAAADSFVIGQIGQALSLDGSTQYATVPDHASLDLTTGMTLAAWIRPGVAGTQDLIKKATNGAVNGYELTLAQPASSSGPQRVFARINQVTSGDTFRVNSTQMYPTDGTWWHVAATYDGSTIRLYINGQLDASVAAPGPIATNNLPVSIGAESSGARKYTGLIDDARIYNTALSASEIAALAGVAPNDPPDAPTINSPADGSNGIDSSPILSVGVSDPNADALTVTFFGRPFASGNFTQVGQETGVASGTTSTTAWNGLGAGQRFEWYATVSDGTATTTGPTWTFNTAPGADPVFVGVGDIAACETTDDTATGMVIDGIQGTIFTTGDNVYYYGTPEEWNDCYAPTPWGSIPVKSRTRPVPGNHDWGTGGPRQNLDPYFAYFGANATDSGGKSYYSYNIADSNWHVVNLDSECQLVPGGCGAGSPQDLWLEADLAANNTKNVIAIWHKPRYSSGATNYQALQPLWDDLYDAGVDILLDGHDHIYERTVPMKSGATLASPPVADATYGIRQFTVGTGGESHHELGTTLPTSVVRNSTTYGVMKFTLHASTYDWVFLPIAGSTFTDSGTASVHGAPPVGNIAPQAVADSYATPEGTPLVQGTPGVLANDTDANSDSLTAVLDATVSHGTLSLNASGGFTYTPTPGYNGSDSFTYHANDGSANSNVVTVSLTVTAAGTVQGLTALAASAQTWDKPQSKLWQHDGNWWMVAPRSTPAPAGTWIWKLAGDLSWAAVHQLSSGTTTYADVRVVGDVTHILLYGAAPELHSVQYNTATDVYEPWASRPTPTSITLSGSETATIDVDSTGRLWLATESGTNLNVYHSVSPYTTFSGPVTLANNIGIDDIGVVKALPNNTIGVLWSNQTTRRFGFKTHVDGADPAVWSSDEVPASQSAIDSVGSGMADDHLNVKVGADGTLYAAVKTSYDTPAYPRIALLIRRPNGMWDDLYEVDQAGTRGIVMINEGANLLRIVYTSAEGFNNIVYKDSALSSIAFTARQTMLAAPFNEVTSTKQNWTDTLVVVASNASNSIDGVIFGNPSP